MITVITCNGQKREIPYDKGQSLLDFLRKNGYKITANCSGHGICGKCKVKLLEGSVDGTSPDENGDILSCKAILCQDVTIELNEENGFGLNDFNSIKVNGQKDGLGVALDVGTTTLGACLINLKDGEILKKTSSLNPQKIYGADVLNRIQACKEGNLLNLQTLILEETRKIIDFLAENQPIEELIVSANTTMLHLFLGVDPEPIGTYPFTPVFTDMKIIDGKDLFLPVKTVKLLPSASAYIGSDITAGILACDFLKTDKTELFVDVGTNGEIVLAHKGEFYAVSTASGPALEGACIERGMGGVEGAINKAYIKDGELCFTTINDVQAKGICGSGLIDLIAVLLGEELIDEYGAWNEESASPLKKFLSNDRFYITDSVYLSQKDIRQYQLAKSAICAGIETLLQERGVLLEEISTTYIAGGLGFYMDVENASKTGLLPKQLLSTTRVVGNTSLAGARLCLIDEKWQNEIQKIASKIQIVELSFSTLFQELYVEKMTF